MSICSAVFLALRHWPRSLCFSARRFPGHRCPVCIKSLSDNTGAEAGSNKMFSMSRPMCFFLEKLCLLAAISGMELDVHHIPGPLNILADDLSRWDGSTPVPGNFLERDRIRISLSDLWISHGSPAVFPADYSLPWVLPTRTNSLISPLRCFIVFVPSLSLAGNPFTVGWGYVGD